MKHHQRSLEFTKVKTKAPVLAYCSLCKRKFVGRQRSGETTDDVILRVRAEFNQHDCREDARQAAARILREARRNI
jgi:hypothetical protein